MANLLFSTGLNLCSIAWIIDQCHCYIVKLIFRKTSLSILGFELSLNKRFFNDRSSLEGTKKLTEDLRNLKR